MFFQTFGRSGTPYLAFVSTVFSLVGIILCLCRPVIAGVGVRSGSGSRASHGSSGGSTMVGGECGQGGGLAILVGLIFLGIAIFFFMVGYRVTKEREEES
ncbi:MAG: hypothetical protein ACJAVK_002138 [Akkermansiaceae bacterium]|jgi:hypothetical protein